MTVGGEQRESLTETERGTERQTDRHTEGDRDTDTWREKGHRGRDAHREGAGRRGVGTCWSPSDPTQSPGREASQFIMRRLGCREIQGQLGLLSVSGPSPLSLLILWEVMEEIQK